ncbi:MAG: hypothetical protein ABL951_02630 [Alphaproteobacteria bacterium]
MKAIARHVFDYVYRDEKGRLHREDGPAQIRPDGYRAYWFGGRIHRLDGPAVIWPDGSRLWQSRTWVDARFFRFSIICYKQSFSSRLFFGKKHKLIIEAGCRRWSTFEDALAHYGPGYKGGGDAAECKRIIREMQNVYERTKDVFE